MDQYDQAEPLDTTTESQEFHCRFARELEKERKDRAAELVIDLVTAENSSIDGREKTNKPHEIREIVKSPRAKDNDGKPEFNQMTMSESPIGKTNLDSERSLQKLVDECESASRTPDMNNSADYPLLASYNKQSDSLNTSIPDAMFPKTIAHSSPRKKQRPASNLTTEKQSPISSPPAEKVTKKKSAKRKARKKSARKSSKKKRASKRRSAKRVTKRARKSKRKTKRKVRRARKRTTKRRVVKRANRRVKRKTSKRVNKRRSSRRVSRKRKTVRKRVKKTKNKRRA